MIKKTITYKDLTGEEFTEDFYFHLSKSEVAELEASEDGGLSATLERLKKTSDPKKVVAILKEVVLKSYGEKSLDGRRFEKSPEMRKMFNESGAYDELFMSFIQDAELAAEFIKGILPDLPEAMNQKANK